METASVSHPAPHSHNVDYLLLALLCLGEAVVFYAHVHLDVAPFYPPAFDQLVYYLDTYDLLGAVRANGATAFFAALFDPNNATGTTFVLQGALLSFLNEASRTTFLTINLIYLLAAQAVLFCAVRSISTSAFGWTAVALFLSTATLFNGAGGLYDYRIDFMAMCLYGTCLSLVLWSRTFLDNRKIVLIGLAFILLIYARFFTIVYIAGFFGILLAIQLIISWLRTGAVRDDATKRARNIFLCGLLIAAACLPRLYLSRDAIYNYYMIGHVLGTEKFIRANELGLHGVLAHLRFYPESILRNHVGPRTWIFAGLLVSLSFWREPVPSSHVFSRLLVFRPELTALFVSLVVPVAILTANISKSGVVGGIVTIPIVLIFVLIGIALWPQGVFFQIKRHRTNLATFAIVAGVILFVLKAHPGLDVENRAEQDKITAMGVAIARYAEDNKLNTISLSVDRVTDYANSLVPRLFSLERLHRNLTVESMFGAGAYGIFATSREDAARLFEQSDVIIMTDPKLDRSVPYPMNTKIPEYWGELWQWTTEHRRPLYSTTVLGVPYHVFVR